MVMGSFLSSSSCTSFFFFINFLISFLYSTLPFSAAVTLERNHLPSLSFEDGYTQLFGDDNLMLVKDGKTVHLSLDQRTGSGFASQDLYLHGFFSAAIKLPSDYAAGVVVAFYMSNGDVFEKTHDELDFEFLGNVRGKEWRVQTNVYGNGSTAIGREERYTLWFDPTGDFHHYSILWSQDQIIFYIDDVPIRDVTSSKAVGGDFPSKPMSLYATIWDGSNWATNGGRYKVNYKYAPYIVEFTDLVLHGCSMDPIEQSSTCDDSDDRRYTTYAMPSGERSAMEDFRKEHMVYSYCYDRERYSTPPPECVINGPEARRFRGSSSVKFGAHRSHGKRHHRAPSSRVHSEA